MGNEPPSDPPGAWPICGDCPTCLDRTNALLRVPVHAHDVPGAARPTAAALERHARRFGPGQVAETAARHGLAVKVKRDAPRRGGGGPSLRTRVAGYLADGYGVDVIAEMEDLSPARARRLVAELS